MGVARRNEFRAEPSLAHKGGCAPLFPTEMPPQPGAIRCVVARSGGERTGSPPMPADMTRSATAAVPASLHAPTRRGC